MVHSLASIGIRNERYDDIIISLLNPRSHSHTTHNSQLKKEAFDDLKAAANAPANLQIVPIHVRDSVCHLCNICDFYLQLRLGSVSISET
jgi:hypothetical protein